MIVVAKKIAFEDERGQIIDIIEGEPVEHATIITCKKGALRGNHYHKKTIQYAYIVSGSMKILTQIPGKSIVTHTVVRGDLMINPPLERHAWIVLEDTLVFVLTKGPRGGKDYESDTYRLPPEERLTNILGNTERGMPLKS